MSRARGEFWSILRVGLPVAATQFAFMLIGVVDTALLGHSSDVALAASAIANMWNWGFLSLSVGLVLGADPFISQAFGRGDRAGVALSSQRALVMATLASIPACLASAFTEPALLFVGQPADVAHAAGVYNLWRLPSTPAFLVFVAQRIYLQGRGHAAPAMWIAIVANVQNLVLGWALIFGKLGFPALGLVGAAGAATLTSLALPVYLALWMRISGARRDFERAWDRRSFSWAGLLQVLRMGLPMSLHSAIEAWGFVIAMLIAGKLGTAETGAHQIGMNLTALAFMVPLGIAIGASARVGNLIGARDHAGARRTLALSLRLALLWSVVAAPLFYVFGSEIGSVFSSDPAIVATVAGLSIYVALFQPFDAIHAVSAGVLRGMGRPGAAALMNFLGFALGLPLAYVWGVLYGEGISAIWQALSLRLLFVSLGVGFWALRTSRLPLDQLAVEPHS